ncbi:MAG: SUMF1/EgtB/PvdO family nonheme iron enzyme [Fimbriiglobus sp.]|jgi:formylglycine-generating enzyme required for sulfatase activity|nr:SUMF1/EgtB/PvdO family nonheme iron enzyme [Fimbriiglobus sp.]
MSRVKTLLDCLSLALCDKARKALFGTVRFGDVIQDVAKATLDNTHKELPTAELRQAIAEMVSLPAPQYAEAVKQTVEGLARVQTVPFKAELIDYLSHVPSFARRFLMRPSDPTGKTVPEACNFFKADELLPMLPPHRPKLGIGREPAGLDNWKLKELIGVGETAETWLAEDAAEPGRFAAIKFAIDDESRRAIVERQELFHEAFKLNEEQGVIPLSSVYLETDPPGLESPFIAGYDLASLIWDWKWKFTAPKPEAALKLVRRLCDIVAHAHAKGVIHRDLKPSNVRLHPTDGGKFTLWVSDYGWGQISSARSLLLSRNSTPRGEQQWLSLRGAHSPLYASPQQMKKDPPDPRDDVYALGMIWFQLLHRDPHAPAPVGNEWADEMRPHGVTDSQVRLLTACLATRPEKRPKNTRELAVYLAQVAADKPEKAAGAETDGSKLIPLKGHSAVLKDAFTQAVAASKAAVPVVATAVPGFGGLPRTVTNSAGITFALIPPGRFTMGSDSNEPGHRNHEGPTHPVALRKPFYLSVYPVTQAQFERVTGRNPSGFTRGHGGGPDHPVEQVSWDDAVRFCERLGRLPDEEGNERKYRLPTEAEWEYACRGGTATPFGCGDKLTPKDAHFAAPGGFGKGGGHTAPVGKCPANPFGLFDMHGNVQEWVSDWYDEYYYHDSPSDDPPGPDQGTLRVVRGGCWTAFPNDCRSAARRGHHPNSPSNTVGFRVVLTVE